MCCGIKTFRAIHTRATMWFVLLPCLLAVSHFTSVAATCDACIHNVCHQKTTVIENFRQLGQIAIDRGSHIFYFHVKDSEYWSYTYAFNLDNSKLITLSDVDYSFARAVDEETSDLYLAEEKRVLKVNPNQNFDNGETVFNAEIWHMQFKDKLYYTVFGSKGIKTFEKGQHKDVAGVSKYNVDEFVVDKDDTIFFRSDFIVYRLKNGETEAKVFVNGIYSLSTDKNKEANFIKASNNHLYKYDYAKEELVEIGAFNVGKPDKAVFTSDNNIIYTDIILNGIYRLLPGNGTCNIKQVGSDMTSEKNISTT